MRMPKQVYTTTIDLNRMRDALKEGKLSGTDKEFGADLYLAEIVQHEELKDLYDRVASPEAKPLSDDERFDYFSNLTESLKAYTPKDEYHRNVALKIPNKSKTWQEAQENNAEWQKVLKHYEEESLGKRHLGTAAASAVKQLLESSECQTIQESIDKKIADFSKTADSTLKGDIARTTISFRKNGKTYRIEQTEEAGQQITRNELVEKIKELNNTHVLNLSQEQVDYISNTPDQAFASATLDWRFPKELSAQKQVSDFELGKNGDIIKDAAILVDITDSPSDQKVNVLLNRGFVIKDLDNNANDGVKVCGGLYQTITSDISGLKSTNSLRLGLGSSKAPTNIAISTIDTSNSPLIHQAPIIINAEHSSDHLSEYARVKVAAEPELSNDKTRQNFLNRTAEYILPNVLAEVVKSEKIAVSELKSLVNEISAQKAGQDTTLSKEQYSLDLLSETLGTLHKKYDGSIDKPNLLQDLKKLDNDILPDVIAKVSANDSLLETEDIKSVFQAKKLKPANELSLLSETVIAIRKINGPINLQEAAKDLVNLSNRAASENDNGTSEKDNGLSEDKARKILRQKAKELEVKTKSASTFDSVKDFFYRIRKGFIISDIRSDKLIDKHLEKKQAQQEKGQRASTKTSEGGADLFSLPKIYEKTRSRSNSNDSNNGNTHHNPKGRQ